MNWWKVLGGGAAAAAAPFTGGASLAWLPAALGTAGVTTALSGAFEGGGPKTTKPGTDASLDPLLRQLTDASRTTRDRGASLRGEGDAALAPVLKYFQQLIGGDPEALMEATRPERARVIDQYDSARRAISEFSPRGGGTNSALASSQVDQSNTLANITAGARQNAVTASANLGTTLTGLGLSADQLASADLNTVIQAILSRHGLDLQKGGQDKALAGGLAEGLGALLGLYLTRGQQAS